MKWSITFFNKIVRKLPKCFVMVPIILSLTLSFAQEPFALKLNKTNGLPDNAVFNMKQDSKGFIWIASREGLTRYDGVHYQSYYSSLQTSTPGSSIQEDVYGRIWYENFDGYLYYLAPNADTLQSIKQSKPIGYVPYGMTNQYIFVFQEKGVDVFSLENLEKITSIPIDIIELNSACSDNENFYFLNNNQLNKIDKTLNLTIREYNVAAGEITKQLYTNDNGFFVLSKHNENKAIHFFDKDLNLQTSLPLLGPKIILAANFIEGDYWIHSTEGTFLIKKDQSISQIFPNKNISGVLLDLQNNYWISTPQEGIFIVPNLNSPIHQIEGFQPNKIIQFDENQFIIATKKGEILLVDGKMNWIKTLYTSTNNSEITYLYLDPNKEFVAFSNLNFNILSLKTNALSSYFIAVKELAFLEKNIYSFAASGLMGFYTDNSSPNESSPWFNIAKKFPDSENRFFKIKENIRVRSTAYVKNNKCIYYASNVGLFAFDEKGEREIKWNNESFLSYRIVADENNVYALSSKGNLYKIDAQDNFESLNEKYGLAPFSIRALKLFENQLVFISGQYIQTIDLKSGKSTKYDINISAYEINDLFLDERNLYIVTQEGIIQIPTLTENNKEPILPLFHITQLYLGNQKLDYKVSHAFSHEENEIHIHFSLLDFGKINTAPLFYAINNKEWIPIDAQKRSLDFPNLAPGDYNIQFKVNDIIQEESISFTIAPPFWKRAWFIALIALSILGLIYLYYKRQVSQLNKQISLLKANIELEKNLSSSILTSIKAQMNPHFFYNALNTIQAYIFENDKRNASKYLTKFSKLTRLILEMSEKEKISLQEELEALSLYLDLEKMRFSEDFEFNINVDKNIETDFCKIPSMLIQPYVENAIKHGLLHSKNEKKLQINFKQDKQYLVVCIEDNGVGRNKSKEMNTLKENKPSSFSSSANEKRLAIINKDKPEMVSVLYEDLQDVLRNSLGTRVTLRIQLI